MITGLEVVGRDRGDVFKAWLFESAEISQRNYTIQILKEGCARENKVDSELRELRVADKWTFDQRSSAPKKRLLHSGGSE